MFAFFYCSVPEVIEDKDNESSEVFSLHIENAGKYGNVLIQFVCKQVQLQDGKQYTQLDNLGPQLLSYSVTFNKVMKV